MLHKEKTIMDRVQQVKDEEVAGHRRMEELATIIKDPSSSIVKRSRAQVELSQLQKRFGEKVARPSVRALMNHDLVTKNAAMAEVRIKREEQRVRREKEIEKIMEELRQEQHDLQRRAKLEKRLSDAQDAVAAMLLVEEKEAEEAALALISSPGRNNIDVDDAPTSPVVKKDRRELLPSPEKTGSALDLLPISPVAEDDEDAGSMPGKPSKTTPLATLDMSKENVVEEPSDAVEEGGQDINERINQLEKQVKEWKEKAEQLTLKCQELEEDKMMQHQEIEALKKRPSVSQRPSLAQRGSSRRFSTRASCSSFSNQLRRQSTMGLSLEKQMREEAELEVQALEERLAEIDGEKGDLLRELDAMRAILQNTSEDDDSVGKKKEERLVYQLSCRKCNKHPNFIGTTVDDIKTTVDRHICRVIEAVNEGKKKSSPSKRQDNVVALENSGKIENWSEVFAQHFAKHCKPSMFKSVSDKDVKRFCKANVKIEVLRRSDGTDLMWESED